MEEVLELEHVYVEFDGADSGVFWVVDKLSDERLPIKTDEVTKLVEFFTCWEIKIAHYKRHVPTTL